MITSRAAECRGPDPRTHLARTVLHGIKSRHSSATCLGGTLTSDVASTHCSVWRAAAGHSWPALTTSGSSRRHRDCIPVRAAVGWWRGGCCAGRGRPRSGGRCARRFGSRLNARAVL
eukprot:5425964-Prymnesium_polylepis.1